MSASHEHDLLGVSVEGSHSYVCGANKAGEAAKAKGVRRAVTINAHAIEGQPVHSRLINLMLCHRIGACLLQLAFDQRIDAKA